MLSHFRKKDLNFKGVPIMSTLSRMDGSTSPTTKRVIFICNNRFDLHEGNTPNAAKRLSLKRYGCMIQFLYLVTVIE